MQKSCQQNSRTSLSSIYELHEVLEFELNVAYSLPFTVSFRFISFHISLCSAWEAEATDRLEVASLETCVLICFRNFFFAEFPRPAPKDELRPRPWPGWPPRRSPRDAHVDDVAICWLFLTENLSPAKRTSRPKTNLGDSNSSKHSSSIRVR